MSRTLTKTCVFFSVEYLLWLINKTKEFPIQLINKLLEYSATKIINNYILNYINFIILHHSVVVMSINIWTEKTLPQWIFVMHFHTSNLLLQSCWLLIVHTLRFMIIYPAMSLQYEELNSTMTWDDARLLVKDANSR